MVRRAQCQCGGFTATAATEPGVVMACHCTWCQRRSGVPVTINAYFKKDDVRLGATTRSLNAPLPKAVNSTTTSVRPAAQRWRGEPICVRTCSRSRLGVSPTRTSRHHWCRCGKRRCADGSSSPRARSTFLARDSARGRLSWRPRPVSRLALWTGVSSLGPWDRTAARRNENWSDSGNGSSLRGGSRPCYRIVGA
jgi:glutathione-dependent formaldehyde-activating enzyme